MALWDIAGKAADLPIYKLLGGKLRKQGVAFHSRMPAEEADFFYGIRDVTHATSVPIHTGE